MESKHFFQDRAHVNRTSLRGVLLQNPRVLARVTLVLEYIWTQCRRYFSLTSSTLKKSISKIICFNKKHFKNANSRCFQTEYLSSVPDTKFSTTDTYCHCLSWPFIISSHKSFKKIWIMLLANLRVLSDCQDNRCHQRNHRPLYLSTR
jgi:hypothetical protein